jgi:uncharacterized protein YndB with AHSA1/START domain
LFRAPSLYFLFALSQDTNVQDTEFKLIFSVNEPPGQVFSAINDVASWWSGEIDGAPTQSGAEFTYRVPGVHFSRQKVTEYMPNKKIVWHVVEARLEFTSEKQEWVGTDVIFELEAKGSGTEVTFTHRGLATAFECYHDCSSAWRLLVNGNLRRRIDTGQIQPSPW